MCQTLRMLSGSVVVIFLSVMIFAQGETGKRRGRELPQTDDRASARRLIHENHFNIEVLTRGSVREKYAARGKIYVEASEGEEYALRLSNPLPVRVAVALSVDGLNTIDARRTSAREASKWVIPPYASITVSGWQMSSTRARRFYFTNERDSYANRMGRPTDIGVITAIFFREQHGRAEIVPVRPHEARPDDGIRSGEARRSGQSDPSPTARAESHSGRAASPALSDDYAATGIGRAVNNDVWSVEMKLERSPAAEMTLRYEYRDALVRLGVVPRPYPQLDSLRRRERARGFADHSFCPEP